MSDKIIDQTLSENSGPPTFRSEDYKTIKLYTDIAEIDRMI